LLFSVPRSPRLLRLNSFIRTEDCGYLQEGQAEGNSPRSPRFSPSSSYSLTPFSSVRFLSQKLDATNVPQCNIVRRDDLRSPPFFASSFFFMIFPHFFVRSVNAYPDTEPFKLCRRQDLPETRLYGFPLFRPTPTSRPLVFIGVTIVFFNPPALPSFSSVS